MRFLLVCILSVVLLPTRLLAAVTSGASPVPVLEDPMIFVKKGIAENQKGNFDGALNFFAKALQNDPKCIPAFMARGQAKMQQGEMTDAINDFNSALLVQPTFADAFYFRGMAENEKGDLDAAIADFNQAIKLEPQSFEAFLGRGHAEYLKGNLDGVIADTTQALGINSHLPLAYFYRGLAQGAKGNQPQAAADFEIAAQSGIAEAPFWFWAAKMDAHAESDAVAKLPDLLTKALGGKPDPWLSELANYLEGHSTDTQLLADAQRSPPATHHLPQALFFVGVTRASSGDDGGAAEAFQQVLATVDKNSYLAIESRRRLKKP